MSKIIINNQPELENPPRSKGILIEKVYFKPGYNSFDSGVIKTLKDHPAYKERLKWGSFKVITPEVDNDDSSDSVTSLKVDDAVAMVVKTNDVKLLEQWLTDESEQRKRTSVINALNRQIETVKSGGL